MPASPPIEIQPDLTHLSEKTPLNGAAPPLVDQKCSLIYDVAFAALFGLTAGLILGNSFSSHTEWKDRWMVSVIPIAFASNPFRLYPGIGKSRRIARTATISLSCLVGVTANIRPQQIVEWLYGSAEPSIKTKAVILIFQLVLAGTNLYSASRLRHLEPTSSQINIPDSFENILSNQDQTSPFSASIVRSPMNILSFTSSFFGLSQMQQPGIKPEKIREQIQEDIALLRVRNQRSYEIFNLLIVFIQEDAELKEAYNKLMSESAGKLLPDYVESQSTFKDRDIEILSRESKKALYWEGQVTRVRYFLDMNDDFTDLLTEKFLASDLANKEELLEYFGFNT